jgi:2-polyprenyl-3-methyl-5-hydroxy-6-metoxy-1,4-benzoquinol methylase
MSPLSNSYIPPDRYDAPEPIYPLHVYVCGTCLLVQVPQFESAEHIFSDYLYFSSYSQSWLDHCHRYVDDVVRRFALGADHQVIEIASNDGYLLQYFAPHGVPVLGVEPAANVAEVARARGVETAVGFFGTEFARTLEKDGIEADLLIGNNVLAHVPDLNDFVSGLSMALAPTGVITLEFPHLLQLMRGNQFDTIYHEHFSYFSFLTITTIFAHHGLRLFDVEELGTHGGSLRIYACHAGDRTHAETERPEALRATERVAGLDQLESYSSFAEGVRRSKRALLTFLIEAKERGQSIVAYGAPAKGNTLLNYCGVRQDFIDYTVDRSPYKQGTALPGTRIPVYPPERILETKPDFVLILPWNLRDEIISEMAAVRDWNGRFVVPIPTVQILD